MILKINLENLQFPNKNLKMREKELKKMKKEQLLGIVRHVLTFVGGILVAKGLATESLSQELIGATMTLVGGIWSIIEKNKTN